ncbi:alcohol dehydrogenase catalytic domain-containing protein [Rhodocaloribacter sp.]
MNMFVIFGTKQFDITSKNHCWQEVALDNIVVRCGLVESMQSPSFDGKNVNTKDMVLVYIKGFSLNYRDKGFIRKLQNYPEHRFSAIGSDFVGEVLEIGAGVNNIEPGDRVIGNSHYEGVPFLENGVRAGIPSNVASKRFRVIHKCKLAKVPDEMTDEVAAGFGINSQTAYSIVRRINPTEKSKILITSSRSNTSISCINALRKSNAKIFALTTSHEFNQRILKLGVSEVLSHDDIFKSDKFIKEQGYFDYVIDPFFDLHIEKAVDVLRPFGGYYTCGFTGKNNDEGINNKNVTSKNEISPLKRVMLTAIIKNLSINGNCLGRTSDLQQAIQDYKEGNYNYIVDSVYHAGKEGEFINRTYVDKARFGKVVYLYND